MPPVLFIEAVLATWNAGSTTMSFATPASARAGDVLLYVIASPTVEALDYAPDAFTALLAQLSDLGVGVNFTVLSVDAVGDQPASRSVVFGAAPSSPPLGACLCYRGMAPGQEVPVASGYAKYNPATTHLAAPSAFLQTYSDLYLGLFYSAAVGATFTPINSLIERVDHANGGGGAGSFAIADVLLNAPGASGTHEATSSAAATGAAAVIVLAAGPLVDVANGGTLTPTPGVPGWIGLPAVGV
jgi:hypothetical protein